MAPKHFGVFNVKSASDHYSVVMVMTLWAFELAITRLLCPGLLHLAGFAVWANFTATVKVVL